ncbi:HupE/UreJ family protein [Palleronia marisminoris]|uniref:HupE/UreJ family protein n=1 Tax=Palleronia marisminoris TaxID=315423 RepID=UPI001FEDCCC3|nr:HupE/UreJ family protein [Palleronia marisminoris]
MLTILAAPVVAHEVQPSVMNLTLQGNSAQVEVEATLEPMIAGVDLDGLSDTNNSDRSDETDRLRALPPEELAAAFRENWSDMQQRLQLRVDGEPVPLELQDVSVPPVGNPALPRVSTFSATAELPPEGGPVTVAWDPSLGAVAIRQLGQGNEGYTAYLTSGGETDPIPRTGASTQGFGAAFLSYIPVGFEHIVPLGLDHILFVLGLFFLAAQLRPLLWQVTAFTLAHTVTLALAALGIVQVPAAVVEPLIAASIVYVGVENVLARGLSPWRPVVIVLFGLLHGLGFASVLSEYGLGAQNFVAKLIGFNIGVEIGQLAVIAAAFLIVAAALRHDRASERNRPLAYGYMVLSFVAAPALLAVLSTMLPIGALMPLIATAAVLFGFTAAALVSDGADSYRQNVANPASILIALTGAYWFVERVFL